MDELMDMIATDESPSQISDKIKDLLFAKSAERIDAFRPMVANSIFGEEELEDTYEVDETEYEEDEDWEYGYFDKNEWVKLYED